MTEKSSKAKEKSTLVEDTVASGIWAEIKNKKLNMFALPPQPVENVFKPFPADPNVLHLSYNISSALPALEEALGPAFLVELAGKYVTVSRINNG